MKEIKPIAMPNTHQKFLPFFLKNSDKDDKVLDVGAGHGAFSKKLFDMGYKVTACDLFPEIFHFDKIPCDKVDITQPFPYEDNSFDAVIAIEVMEHITDHESFFSEVSRILKPDGQLYISTPNILSLKSRIRFLFSGFFYSFQPLDLKNYDGLQHVASLTLDQYNYIAVRNGFKEAEYEVDKLQSTSKWLMIFYPILMIYPRLKKLNQIHNEKKLLLGRLLFLIYNNNK